MRQKSDTFYTMSQVQKRDGMFPKAWPMGHPYQNDLGNIILLNTIQFLSSIFLLNMNL